MQDDVPHAKTLKRQLKRLRDEENEVRRAVAAEALSVGRRHEYRGTIGFTYLEEYVASSLVVKESGSYNCAVTYLLGMQGRSHHTNMPPRTRHELMAVLPVRFARVACSHCCTS